jgi:hypothetical protein
VNQRQNGRRSVTIGGVDEPNLTPEEDAELRRLHLLKSFGMVGSSIVTRYNALKGRDRRKAVRDPDDSSIAQPIEKSPWGEPPPERVVAEAPTPESAALDEVPAQSPRVDPTRHRSDTRNVVADTGRRGRFRR